MLTEEVGRPCGGIALVPMMPHLLVASLAQAGSQPLETLIKTVTGGSAGGLDVLEERSARGTSRIRILAGRK